MKTRDIHVSAVGGKLGGDVRLGEEKKNIGGKNEAKLRFNTS